METTRQQKIAKQIQKDAADIFQKEGAQIVRGALVTVTAVRVSPDFSYAKIYVSIFPFEQSGEVMQRLEHQNWFIRRALGQRLRNQLKNVPEIQFFLDDSLEYIDFTNDSKPLKTDSRMIIAATGIATAATLSPAIRLTTDRDWDEKR